MLSSKTRSLFVSDSDGTIFNTFESSPNGVDVKEAYNFAIQKVLGGIAFKIYNEAGGLRNRAPAQVVAFLMRSEYAVHFLETAERFFKNDKEMKKLEGLIPTGKGAPLVWNNYDHIPLLTELLVLVKLNYLMEHVGAKLSNNERWPRMFNGVDRFIYCLEQEHGIDFCVLSSGHEFFIQKCFNIHGLSYPTIMVTDDDMRSKTHFSVEERSKPSPVLMQYIKEKWAERHNLLPQNITETKIAYTGDDLLLDGMTAQSAKARFWHFFPEGGTKSSLNNGKYSRFQDWNTLTEMVRNKGPKSLM